MAAKQLAVFNVADTTWALLVYLCTYLVVPWPGSEDGTAMPSLASLERNTKHTTHAHLLLC